MYEFNSLASAHSFVLRAKPNNILKEILGFQYQIILGESNTNFSWLLSPTINWKI